MRLPHSAFIFSIARPNCHKIIIMKIFLCYGRNLVCAMFENDLLLHVYTLICTIVHCTMYTNAKSKSTPYAESANVCKIYVCRKGLQMCCKCAFSAFAPTFAEYTACRVCYETASFRVLQTYSGPNRFPQRNFPITRFAVFWKMIHFQHMWRL